MISGNEGAPALEQAATVASNASSCFRQDSMTFCVVFPVCVCVTLGIIGILLDCFGLDFNLQGDNPMDAVGCPTKRAAFHG